MFDASPQEYVGRSLLRPSRPPRHLSWQIDQQDLAGRGAPDLEHRLTLDRGGVALTERLAVHRDAALRHEHVRAPAGGERVGHALSGVELRRVQRDILDRKSTRLNSSHGYISYAVFCLKKKKKTTPPAPPTLRPRLI